MQWVNGTRVIDGVQRPVKILNFAIEAGTEGGIVLANSNGIIPDVTGDFLEFNPLMFERFDITIDQLEGEINCPYIFQRLEPEIEEARTCGASVPTATAGGMPKNINRGVIKKPPPTPNKPERPPTNIPIKIIIRKLTFISAIGR